jgi:hypothetical protein
MKPALPTMASRILKIALKFYGPQFEPRASEAIYYEGELWIVVRWLENPGLGIAKPARIVRADNLVWTHDIPPQMAGRYDLVVLTPIPESVLDPDTPLPVAAPFVAIDHPDITVEIPSGKTTLQ